jgi:glycosyltransferase involved in cell wall biosynthesis
MTEGPRITAIIPCLNEQGAIAQTVRGVDAALRSLDPNHEIIVVDNGSTDNSLSIIQSLSKELPSVRTITEDIRGYGAAYLAGIDAAQGALIVMIDGDDSYDPSDIKTLVQAIRTGADIAIGDRLTSLMDEDAMPALHRYFGNPVLSFVARLCFGLTISDTQCGLRVAKTMALRALDLRALGMEFATEMLAKAQIAGAVISEAPISYRKRIGVSKLRSFADGWRHVRFMLLFSPFWVFFAPGAVAAALGTIIGLILLVRPIPLLGITLIAHPMFACALLVIIGYQSMLFAGFSKAYGLVHLSIESLAIRKILSYFTLERGLILGTILAITGFGILTGLAYNWAQSGYGTLDAFKEGVVALTLTTLGVQTALSAIMLSILGIPARTPHPSHE